MFQRVFPTLVASCVCAGFLACAHLGITVPACPAEGGPGWHELVSRSFVLRTDRPVEDAKQIVTEMEKVRAAMLALAWNGAEGPNERFEVITLYSKAEFSDFFPEGLEGFVTTDDFGRFGAFHSDLTKHIRSVLTHEYAHYLSGFFMPRQPRWFAEGLASYLETVRVDEDGMTGVMGEPADRLAEFLSYRQSLRRIPVQTLLSIEKLDYGRGNESATAAFYESSWLLVHYLVNHHGAQFADLQKRLTSGEAGDRAWADAFAGVSPEQLDTELGVYLRTGEYLKIRGPIRALDVHIAVRELTDAEAHATRARLRQVGTHFASGPAVAAIHVRVEAELAEALRQDPKNGLALALRAAMAKGPAQLAAARAAVAEAPKDWRGWVIIERALRRSRGAEHDEAITHLVELGPNNARVLNDAAWAYATTGRAELAFPLAARALGLARNDAAVLDTYAAAAFGVHKCAEAIRAEQTAIDIIPDESRRQMQPRFEKRLAEMTRGCQTATEAAPLSGVSEETNAGEAE